MLRIRIGRALQQHRTEAGLTQADLAEYADLSLKYVGEVERGEANPTMEVLERLAAAARWDPMKSLDGLREPITEGMRIMLIETATEIIKTLQQVVRWLQAMDPRLNSARFEVARVSEPRRLDSRSRRGADHNG